jgi:cytidylate kinase
LIPKVVQTVLHLANVGHVILVGRGASVITKQMPNVFHVRLIASLARRIERVQELENLSPKEAATFIAQTERGRERYVRAYFHTRVNDDLQYHLVINTDRIPPPEAAELIADGAQRCFHNGLEAHNSSLAHGEQESGVPATKTDLAGFIA